MTLDPENSIFSKKGNGPIFTTSGDCESCTLTVKNFDVEFNLDDQNRFSKGGGFTCGVTVGPGNITLSGVSIKASKSENSNPYAICGIDDQNVKIPTLKNVNAENVKGMLLGFRAPEVGVPLNEYPIDFIKSFQNEEGFTISAIYSFDVSSETKFVTMNFKHSRSMFFAAGGGGSEYEYLPTNSKESLFFVSFEKTDDSGKTIRRDFKFVRDFPKLSITPEDSSIKVSASKMTDQKNIAVERLSPDALVINTSTIPYKEANVVVDPEPGDGDDKEDGKDEDEGEDKKDGGDGGVTPQGSDGGTPLDSGGDGGVTPQGDGGENPVYSGGSCTLINSVSGAAYASLITLLLVMMPSILMRLSAVRSRKR